MNAELKRTRTGKNKVVANASFFRSSFITNRSSFPISGSYLQLWLQGSSQQLIDCTADRLSVSRAFAL